MKYKPLFFFFFIFLLISFPLNDIYHQTHGQGILSEGRGQVKICNLKLILRVSGAKWLFFFFFFQGVYDPPLEPFGNGHSISFA